MDGVGQKSAEKCSYRAVDAPGRELSLRVGDDKHLLSLDARPPAAQKAVTTISIRTSGKNHLHQMKEECRDVKS